MEMSVRNYNSGFDIYGNPLSSVNAEMSILSLVDPRT
jgi:hypothetical protein